jgi:peptidoglycan/LPS O-acetylase OafA/YrhL
MPSGQLVRLTPACTVENRIIQFGQHPGVSPSDEDILAASVESPHAFGEVFEKYFATIHGYLARNTSPLRRARRRAGVAGVVGLIFVVALVEAAGDEDPFLGGWPVQALAAPIAEATIAVALSLWLIGWLARRWNHHGPLARSLGRASFAAYVIHLPVVVTLSAILSTIALVVEVKFVVVAVSGVAVSFAVGWVMTRAPLLSRLV